MVKGVGNANEGGAHPAHEKMSRAILEMEPTMDLIIHNAKIWLGNASFAQALAANRGRIAAVGTNQQVQALGDKTTRIIDAGGRLLLPGFNDAHVHLIEGGFHLLGVDLRDARDPEEFCRRLRAKAAQLPRGCWITGGFWDHEGWPDKQLPNKELIDRAVPDHPIFVVRIDWHIGCANSLALNLAGIDSHTKAPPGGVIDRDAASGEPTGILRETAHRLIDQAKPPPDKEQTLQALRAALNHAAALGVTSIQGACQDGDIALYQELLETGELTLRISAWHNVADRPDIQRLENIEQIQHPYLRTGTAKFFCDGSFGATTALLSQPYLGDAENVGVAVHDEKEFIDIVDVLHRNGRQMAIHAIGDRAVTRTLDAIAAAQKQHGRKNLRHRIEHAQMVRDQDMKRFEALGIVASVQPSHAIDDMRWIENRVGERASTTYRLNSFYQAGAAVAFGTDWTVEPIDPMLTLYAAVTREYPQGGPEGGWQPQEKVTLEQALTGYTIGSAFAEHCEQVKGRLSPGFYADLVILSQDLFTTPPRQWLETKVDVTVVGGKVVFER
ncbi:amidohydrolase [candidate division KSB1 bacterium]|nr:amidohydrolase [candidate division KSB1 bacterium]